MDKIILESRKHRKMAGGRRTVYRKVREMCAELQPKARGWMGTYYWQWTGIVQIGGTKIKVWGYRRQIGAGSVDMKPPDEWADDSY